MDTAQGYADSIRQYTPTQVSDNLPSGQSVLDTISAPFSFLFNAGKSAATALTAASATTAPQGSTGSGGQAKPGTTAKPKSGAASKPSQNPSSITPYKSSVAPQAAIQARQRREAALRQPQSSNTIYWLAGIALVTVGVIVFAARD